ncbi:hypothetical protein PHAVU_007G059800 [Phaseolus vulgaris]|uniref:Cupin type-1 domain-containing protein n=1 Tax=Phaseolus vulgaris TaxID=3885 RepID=V7BBT5_PHAVU|nr:hypothetical protein PHAVU_007G059800g [Phaseolus vulgaris]ESW15284.1 hypothetical protein PHAVU_007G059800g [Phaseolus vulgaris]
MGSRFPLLMLLGIVFLASVSESLTEKPSRRKCVKICESEKDLSRGQTCQLRCKHVSEPGGKEEEEREIPEPHLSHEERVRRERGHQEGEKKKKEVEKEEREKPRPFPPPHPTEHEREEEQWTGRHRRGDPEERERVRQREREEEEIRERERKKKKGEKHWRREKKEKWEEIEEDPGFPNSDSQTQNNPFHFSSNRFRTLFKNKHGHIRVLQRFDQRSSTKLQNLQDYRVVEFKSRPHTLLLPHRADADFLLVVLSGRALINFVEPEDRDCYYLDPGYAQIIPAGTTFYLVNPERNKNLRVIKLAIPVNKPGKFDENFFLSRTQDQQFYLQGFSGILEASFDDSKFEEINKVLFGEERPQEGVIVELSNEKIRKLSRSAESSSRKINSFEYKPFDLRSSSPIYSNKFGAFYEITPDKNPHLRKLNILLNYVDINKGGLLLPHYNSKAIVILVVSEGEANIELLGLREQQQEERREVQKYRAELSEDDVFIIPAAYPVAINATSNLNFIAFGINAENNQRNFLAGEKENVISEIPRQVLEVNVEKLIKKQRESYFVDAQPQQQQKENTGRNGRKVPLSSILGALY